jgi:hypothetical protein
MTREEMDLEPAVLACTRCVTHDRMSARSVCHLPHDEARERAHSQTHDRRLYAQMLRPGSSLYRDEHDQ